MQVKKDAFFKVGPVCLTSLFTKVGLGWGVSATLRQLYSLFSEELHCL